MLTDAQVVTIFEEALKKGEETSRWDLSYLLKQTCVQMGLIDAKTEYSPLVECLVKSIEAATQRSFIVVELRRLGPEATKTALQLSVAWARMQILRNQLSEMFTKGHQAREAIQRSLV